MILWRKLVGAPGLEPGTSYAQGSLVLFVSGGGSKFYCPPSSTQVQLLMPREPGVLPSEDCG